jgi:hypothetical protein
MFVKKSNWDLFSMRARAALPALLVATVFAISLQAQQNPCALRNIIVGVTDEKGQPVTGLTAQSFRATMRGNALQILEVTPAPPPERIVIALDMSASMVFDFKRQTADRTIKALISGSAAGTQIAVVTFGEQVRTFHTFTGDHASLVSLLDQYLPREVRRGGTALYDAMSAGVDMLAGWGSRGELVVVSDGGDTASRMSHADVGVKIAESGIRFQMVKIESPEEPRIAKQRSATETAQLTELTGWAAGKFFLLSPANPDGSKKTHGTEFAFHVEKNFVNISEVGDNLLREMATGYQLKVILPNGMSRPIEWKLEIAPGSVPSGQRVSLRYAPRLFPCHTSTTGN